jgi:hypothetical protein
MSDISKLAHVLRQYEVFRKGPDSKGGGDFHKGLNHLRNVDQDRVAERVLQRDLHNRKAVASMFKMAESVERLLHPNLGWKERRDLGRLLISSLCYAELYRLEREGDLQTASERLGHASTATTKKFYRNKPTEVFPLSSHKTG